MSIWLQHDRENLPHPNTATSKSCIYCGTMMHRLSDNEDTLSYERLPFAEPIHGVRICPRCGWWNSSECYRDSHGEVRENDPFATGVFNFIVGAASVLRQLNLKNCSEPLIEVASYLVARYEERFDVNPRLWELTIGEVFRGAGYSVVVTAYQKDGGIDCILHDARGHMTGVQVKRTRNKISVSQIREFCGSLYFGDLHAGIFVTTSSFTKDAESATGALSIRGMPIELYDAEKLYSALSLINHPVPMDYSEFKQIYGIPKIHRLETG